MEIFEACYWRGCKLPIQRFESSDVKSLAIYVVNKAQERARDIQAKLLVAQSRQKDYVDRNARDMTFQVGGTIFVKSLTYKRSVEIL